jgi:sulfate adenylyltransferase
MISPYGDKLVDLLVPADERPEVVAKAGTLASIQISDRSVCDLELLATGAFSPLDRFMGEKDYQRVLEEMRLVDGHIFPIPVTLPVGSAPQIHLDHPIALRNSKNELLGVMTIEEIYEWDLPREAEAVFRTQDVRHSGVPAAGRRALSGRRLRRFVTRTYTSSRLAT